MSSAPSGHAFLSYATVLLLSVWSVGAAPMFNGNYNGMYLHSSTPDIDDYHIPLINEEEDATWSTQQANLIDNSQNWSNDIQECPVQAWPQQTDFTTSHGNTYNAGPSQASYNSGYNGKS